MNDKTTKIIVMNFKQCNNCGTLFTQRNKVKNRCVCKTCFKQQKAKYDTQRDRKVIPVKFTIKCKFCLNDFETYKHDKLYCSIECKRRYVNAVRRVNRRK